MKERTITETEVVEKEKTEYKCEICEQWFKGNEVIPININIDESRNICDYCAEHTFDYKPDKRKKLVENKNAKTKYTESMVVEIIKFIIGVLLGLMVISFVAMEMLPQLILILMTIVIIEIMYRTIK